MKIPIHALHYQANPDAANFIRKPFGFAIMAVVFLSVIFAISTEAQQVLTIAPSGSVVMPTDIYSATNYSGVHSNGFGIASLGGTDRVDVEVTNLPSGVTVFLTPTSFVPGSSFPTVFQNFRMNVAITNVAEGEYTLYLVASSTNTSIAPKVRPILLSVGDRTFWVATNTASINWSTSSNWSPNPPAGRDVVFEDQSNGAGTNNVTASITIGRLTYLRAQNNIWWRTVLSSGVTLTVTNGFSANSLSPDNGGGTSHNFGLDIRGSGGATLLVTNFSKDFALNEVNSAAIPTSPTYKFDFSALPNLKAYVRRFGVNDFTLITEGTVGSQNTRCDLAANNVVVASYMGDYTQESFTNSISIWHHGDQSAYQNGQVFQTTLGSSSTFWGDSFVLAGSRVQSANNVFSARSSGSTAQFRNADGISRMTLFGAAVDSGVNTIGSGSRVFFNFANSSLDILADNLWLGRCRPRQGAAANAHIHGTLWFGSGSVVDVNTAVLGYQAYTNDNDCRGIITNASGTFVVNKELVLGYTVGDFVTNRSSPSVPFPSAGFGRLTITGSSGRARINTVTIGGPANMSIDNDINILSSGGLFLTNTIGTSSAKLSLLNVNASFLTLHINGLDTRIFTKNVTTTGACPINFASITNVGPFPALIPLISYESASGSGFTNGTMPSATPAYAGYITNDTSAKIIYLVLTNGPTQPGPVTWTGNTSDDWDTTTTNWLSGVTPYKYADGVPVRFDDSGNSGNVNLTGTRAPAGTTVDNSSLSYTFTGSGKLSGSGGLTKQSSGTLTIANSGVNDFTGSVTVSAGTLQVGNGGSSGNLGTGNITNNASLIINRSGSLSVLNKISGTGSLTNNGGGTTTLGGTNTYTGNTTVNAGTLALIGGAEISSSANITIASGATLDASGRTDGTLTLNSGQTLKDNGTIQGNLTASAGSSILPGQSVGRLNVGNTVVLQGTITMEIDKAAGTNDVLSGNSITYGGTLTVVNLNTPISQNDEFKLFSASSYSGAFTSIVPSTPGFGLIWDTSGLTNNGTLKAVSDAPAGLLVWTGSQNNNWDTTTTNWLDYDSTTPVSYTDGLPVRFDDTGITNNVNLTTTLSPSLTIVNNNTDNYTFIGSGKLSGSSSLIKAGSGTLTIANSGINDFSGGVAIGGGIVQVGNGGTSGNLGSGNITNNASLIFNRSDNLSVPNIISGIGSLTQDGAGTTTLSAVNTYTGDTLINAGTMVLSGSAQISGSVNIRVASGAVLDVSGRTDGTLTLANNQTLRGNGVVRGAVTNSPGSSVSPGQSVGYLTVSNAVVLQGTVTMEIDKTAGTNDLLRGDSISYGGTLVISNLSAAFADGDSFKLFDADSYSGTITNIIPKKPGTGLAWDTTDLTDSGSLKVTLAPPVTPTPSIKVDFSLPGRAEAIDPNFLSWVVNGGTSVSNTFNGITITFTKVGPFGTGITADWWKAGVDDFHCLMADDGITVANGNQGGQIEMRIHGLSAGSHSIATFHNSWGDPATHTFSPMNVSVNGVLTFTNFVPSNRVTNNYDAASVYMQVVAEEDEDIVVLYQADTNNAATDKNVWICGIEIDTVDSTTKALNPYPQHRDEHVDADADKSVLMRWFAAASAVSHDVYFGTSSNAVLNATNGSPEFMGNQAGTNILVTNLSTFLTYYWRVDEVNATNGVAKGDLWYFRTRHLAFPGAEGYGRFARGGRGGRVIEVTNLNDSGPGSFRDAIMQTGPRTIVFAVSGLITLESHLTVNGDLSKLTIAGQTAPGKGINIRKYSFGFSGGQDIIVRHMRVYPGKLAGITLNGMGFGGVDHAIMDHCSSGWSLDECIPSRGANNMTIQHVMIAEPLNQAGHKNYPPGTRHGYASSSSGDIGSWHHDLLTHSEGRNWSLAGGLDGNGVYAGRLDIRCNVVYNWNGRTTDGGVARLNFVNNYYKKGPAGGINTYLNPDHGTNADGSYGQMYYSSGNVMPGFPQSNTGGWMTNQPFFPSYVTTQSATNAYKIVMSDVGCTQPMIDNHDTRVLNETRTGTYTYSGSASGLPGLPDSENDVGGWESYPEIHRDANFDTDHDGLPDWWEIIKGLNTNSAPGDFSDSNADLEGDEYTELDRYVNWMAVPHYDCNKNAFVDVDLSQYTKGFTAGPVHSVMNPTNGTVIILGDGKTARFMPTASFVGLARYNFSVVDTAGDSMTNKVVEIHVVDVAAANTAPQLATNSNSVVNVGVTVVVTNVATDSDVPAQTLTFSLLTGPLNATLNTNSGVFSWRPQVTHANSTNLFTISVTDDGTPNLSATNSFSVTVNPLTLPNVTSPTWAGGQFSATVNGQTGPDYAVQNSTNLLNWSTLLITNSPVMPFNWTDINTSTSRVQFYRIKVGPPLP